MAVTDWPDSSGKVSYDVLLGLCPLWHTGGTLCDRCLFRAQLITDQGKGPITAAFTTQYKTKASYWHSMLTGVCESDIYSDNQGTDYR